MKAQRAESGQNARTRSATPGKAAAHQSRSGHAALVSSPPPMASTAVARRIRGLVDTLEGYGNWSTGPADRPACPSGQAGSRGAPACYLLNTRIRPMSLPWPRTQASIGRSNVNTHEVEQKVNLLRPETLSNRRFSR